MNTLLDAVEEQKAIDAIAKETLIKEADNVTLIHELYSRGVPMKDIFGRYYEFEEAGNARTMDVEDAQLVFGELEGADF